MKEHARAVENQQKQLAALKKGGKSTQQAEDDIKTRMAAKQNKQNKGKKGSATIGDEGW